MAQNLLLIFLFAFLVGKLEGNIEGAYPWAVKLPTKKFKNKLTDLVLDGKPVTSYHLWLFSLILLVFHYHFLFTNWSLKSELLTLSGFLLFAVVEDALSITLNPNFGLKKFSKKFVTWHINWVGFLPVSYLHGLAGSLFFYLLAQGIKV